MWVVKSQGSPCYIDCRNSSSIFNPILPVSGDGASSGNDSDLVHCCAEFFPLGLGVSNAGARLRLGGVPVIGRRGS